MTPTARALVLVAAALTLGGCAFGYNRVLFVTKTNVGLEATSTPPALQLAITRTEGVIAPQFANGAKLPVMASFRFASDGLFAPAVGSAFTTGDAAYTMAALYSGPTPLDWQGRVGLLTDNSPTDSTLSLPQAPTLPRLFGLFPLTFQTTDVRPVFFGTDTSLGVKIAWSGATGQFPDSARFGYNRTELALVPIAMETLQNGAVRMRMSSLMATIDAGVSNVGTATQPGADVRLVQYFATGRAATLMALQQDVRKAMLARLDPHQAERTRQFEGATPEQRSVALSFLPSLYRQIADAAPADPAAATLKARMEAAVPADIAGGATLDFTRYDYGSPPNLAATTAPQPLAPTMTSMDKLVFYNAQLARSVEHLDRALADSALAAVNGTPLTSAGRDGLKRDLDAQTARLAELDKRLDDSRAVFRDAMEYFYR